LNQEERERKNALAAKESASRAASSFRVTLDDPCFKVLPAALKKYKINDDWKMYALFICFGNTGTFSAVFMLSFGPKS
jgi:hypothetical protein